MKLIDISRVKLFSYTRDWIQGFRFKGYRSEDALSEQKRSQFRTEKNL